MGLPAALVVGSGPNGLAAAIVLAQNGFAVEVHEKAAVAGGAMRSGELTLPGFTHDLGSAVHPLGAASPFFTTLPLAEHGLRWIWPPAALAHPFDDGTAVTLERDVSATAEQCGVDASAYRKLFAPLTKDWALLVPELLRPLRWPEHPFLMARFGAFAVPSCTFLSRALFSGERARAFFAGICAHSTLKLEAPLSSGFGLILGAAGHAAGWPIPEGGSQRIAEALVGVLQGLGGSVVTGSRVASVQETSGANLTLCDVTPQQFLRLAEGRLPGGYRSSLQRYRYGPAVFKVDWALREPIPWKAKDCLRAATVHLGGSLEEMAASERAAWDGQNCERPFVILAQPSLFDRTRAPAGLHTAWAYCHVPFGSKVSMLSRLEAQIERFAPGFRECVLARSAQGPAEMQAWNENLVGGGINGGAATLRQFVLRPTWRRYGTPLRGVYLCSSSTPPGGGVHGMCGYWAAQRALQA
ncbi:MAG TPA: NAD(P)/FAD-dependent oxidoreductase [Bryobacteraceae bacterium]|nr:NAD(P)/FAD-dependent oxidoreductase [Bryobacteraceae bacterium]